MNVESMAVCCSENQERMSRRRRRRSVELVKVHVVVPHTFWFIPYMEDLCGTSVSQLAQVTVAAQRPICISHLLSSVSQKSLQLH